MDEDDDVPSLSAETFAALQEFYTEQAKRQEILEKLEADDKLKENILFDENWVSFFKSINKSLVEMLPFLNKKLEIILPPLFYQEHVW